MRLLDTHSRLVSAAAFLSQDFHEGNTLTSTLHDPDPEFEGRLSALLLDVLIRAGLVLGLAMICFQVFSPS